MPNVLTATGTVSCGHPPGTVPVQGTAKLRVAGAAVLRKADIDGKPTDGKCGIPVPAQGNKQCTTATVTSGLATKLTIGGMPVVLAGPLGETDGTIGGVKQTLLTGAAGQTKLSSV